LTAAGGESSLPAFENDTYVYDEHILLRTYVLLTGRNSLTLPQLTPILINALYNEDVLPPESALHQPLTPQIEAQLLATHAKMSQETDQDRFAAHQRLVSPSTDRHFLRQRTAGLEEESPHLHTALQALTRLGQPAIHLVCLFEDGMGQLVTPDGQNVTLNVRPAPSNLASLMRATVSVTHKTLRQHFTQNVAVPPAWRDHAHLRDHFPIIFRDGVVDLNEIGYRLTLSPTFGLEIEHLGRPTQSPTPMEDA
jgi:hypothetical protein